MTCCRCKYDTKCWPVHGWTSGWNKGRFWLCPGCLNTLIGWWLDLTITFTEPDPTRNPKKR